MPLILKLRGLLMAVLVLLCSAVQAEPINLSGQWYEAPSAWKYQNQADLSRAGLTPVAGIWPTGGHFIFQTSFRIDRAGRYVLDFKNSSVIGHFRHYLFDSQGTSIAVDEGGIQSNAENPFFLRHGRELELKPGNYTLISELESPFYLAQPQPYVDTVEHYRQAIIHGNVLVLMCLGVFVGLGIYYAALALVRKRVAEGMYAVFILGNLLYNGTALLVYSELFDMHWFYLISVPILFSNCAYIVFVMALLEIRKATHPRLFNTGITLLGVLGVFILTAAWHPNWSLELDRYGVMLFLSYGLAAGILRAREGNFSARLYLIAICIFFALGSFSISQASLEGMYTIYIEHFGLSAVAVEAILLALVLSYQFAQLHREREHALAHAAHSSRIAYTDALTGLPNRYVLEDNLNQLPSQGSLTFIDLDGLKYYNDRFGHERGDDLLRCFSSTLAECLGERACLHRLGGDEFAITCAEGDLDWIIAMLSEAVSRLRLGGYDFAGASYGSVHMHENSSRKELKHMADTRMYENKRRRKVRDQLA